MEGSNTLYRTMLNQLYNIFRLRPSLLAPDNNAAVKRMYSLPHRWIITTSIYLGSVIWTEDEKISNAWLATSPTPVWKMRCPSVWYALFLLPSPSEHTTISSSNFISQFKTKLVNLTRQQWCARLNKESTREENFRLTQFELLEEIVWTMLATAADRQSNQVPREYRRPTKEG